MKNIEEILAKQRTFYFSQKTMSYEFRKQQLLKLKAVVKDNEKRLIQALYNDLHKSEFEAYLSELAMFYQEVDYHIKHLRKNMKKQTVRTPLSLFKAKSFYQYDPYGQVLIIGPFNYPVQLVLMPLVGAIAAGNTIIIKPSEHTINSGRILQELLNETFAQEYLYVVNFEAGKEVVEQLLEQRFDLIFFTGSTRVGKIIAQKAALHLTPVILELGGKSPCIVASDANIEMSAKRIVWGKFLNSGQTCIAPDYLLVHKKIKDELIAALKKEIELQYSKDPQGSDDYGRLVNEASFIRMSELLEENELIYGGNIDKVDLYVAPTLIEVTDLNSRIMQEEIFGPLLPIIVYDDLNKIKAQLNEKEKPLALYYFGSDKNEIEKIVTETRSGGLVINDTLIHCTSENLAFGGVGYSGMGQYHGRVSYETFSHRKGVINRSTNFEVSLRYAPANNKLKIVKKVFK